MSKSGFRKLLELSDRAAKETLGDYYIISESRMNNYLYCLESGADKIKQLEGELSKERERVTELVIENDSLTGQVESLTDLLGKEREEREEAVEEESLRWAKRLEWINNKFPVDCSGLDSGDYLDGVEYTIETTFRELETELAKYQAVVESLNCIIANAFLGPDGGMRGMTDCYHIPLDDIENAKQAVRQLKKED